jgi:intraflagellar transport protein 74
MYGKAPSGSFANRPSSRAGLGSSWGNIRGTTGVPPQTGRLGARPTTKMGLGFQVVDRPMTQQGLGGIKGSNQVRGRMIQDRTFFMSELRHKVSLVTNEINKLNNEINVIEKENENYDAFEKKVDQSANELRELQGQLGDLNTLVDKLNVDTDLEDIERLYNQIKVKNQRENNILNDVFTQRQQKENQIRDIEKKIEEERKLAEEQLKKLDSDKLNQYYEFKEQNAQYIAEIQQKEQIINELTDKEKNLRENLEKNPIKLRAYENFVKINELKEKKESLEEDISSIESKNGPEEREHLLQKVKEDNVEISGMERKITELEEQIFKCKERLSQLDMDMDHHQGEKNSKYEELLKRDKDMQAFIDSFDTKKNEIVEKSTQYQTQIVDSLEKLSSLSKRDMPSYPGGLKELKEDLQFKEKEMKNSENTADALIIERNQRLQDLEKVNQLESKLNFELTSLKNKIEKLNEDMEKIKNIDELKKLTEEQRKKNKADRQGLREFRDSLKQVVTGLSTIYDGKKAQLQENETFVQLGAFEQKLRYQESNNFHLKEYIQTKTLESNYQVISQEILQSIEECNGQILKLMSIPPTR